VPGVSALEVVRIWDRAGVVRVRVKNDDLGVVAGRVGRVLQRAGLEGVIVDVVREV